MRRASAGQNRQPVCRTRSVDATPAAIVAAASGGALGSGPGVRTAALSYFSLATDTATGYGDLVPVRPLARSLANLDATFGQRFPSTLPARLVALRLATGERSARTRAADAGDR